MSARRAPARDNAWLVAQLRELAARLDLDDVPHRPRAYRRAADTIEALDRPVAEVRDREGARGLEALPGIGPHIAGILGELIDTGRTAALERLRSESPIDVMDLLAVDGVGRKTLRVFSDRLGVRTLADLERALVEGRVGELPGFGPRRAERLLQAVRIRQRGHSRVGWKKASALAERLREALDAHPSVVACAVAGSVRRGLATVGDIDLVAASTAPAEVAPVLLERPDVELVYSRGPHRVSVRLAAGIDVDLRTVAPEAFGSALLYFTGNRAHTLALRRLALAQGLRLNEYGLFRGRERIAGETEEGIYRALALPFVPPGSRRGEGEIREALHASVAGADEKPPPSR